MNQRIQVNVFKISVFRFCEIRLFCIDVVMCGQVHGMVVKRMQISETEAIRTHYLCQLLTT